MTINCDQQCEIAWFSALCDDDYEFLGVPDPYLKSSWEHCRSIVLRAEEGGFDNILLPSGYQRSEEHTSELQSLMRISYAVFCLKKKKQPTNQLHTSNQNIFTE